MTSVWIIPLALAIGVALGTLGGGGGILTVPILVYLFGLAPSAATAASLVIVGLMAIAGLVTHYRGGNVRVGDGLLFGLLGAVGAVVGSRLTSLVPPPVLMTAFSVLLLVVAGLMTRRRRQENRQVAAGQHIDPLAHGARRGIAARASAATGVGFLTGFLGVGGGFAIVPALVLVLGFPMRHAVGTSLFVMVINTLTALGGRIGTGLTLDWVFVLTFGLFGAIGSILGSRLARRIDPRRLNLGFTILLVLVAIYTASQSVPQLLH